MRQYTNYCHVLTSTSASEEREYDAMKCQEKVGTEFDHVTTPTSASEEREHDVSAMRRVPGNVTATCYKKVKHLAAGVGYVESEARAQNIRELGARSRKRYQI